MQMISIKHNLRQTNVQYTSKIFFIIFVFLHLSEIANIFIECSSSYFNLNVFVFFCVCLLSVKLQNCKISLVFRWFSPFHPYVDFMMHDMQIVQFLNIFHWKVLQNGFFDPWIEMRLNFCPSKVNEAIKLSYSFHYLLKF